MGNGGVFNEAQTVFSYSLYRGQNTFENFMFYLHYRKIKAVGVALVSAIELTGGQKLFRHSICRCFSLLFPVVTILDCCQTEPTKKPKASIHKLRPQGRVTS